MTRRMKVAASTKALTGIEGFDAMTGGGLPRGRVTLIEGGPGCGKTVMALQTLVNGACREREAGIFVAFEESAERIVANAAQFGWDLETLQEKRLFFLDAQPTPDLVQSGDFDLSGMLAILDAKARQIKARRIVFDAIDMVLALIPDPRAQRREVYRLNAWLVERGLTAIITSKVGTPVQGVDLSFLQFMVDCAITLRHDLAADVSHRKLQVIKYRGSGFAENASPFVIGANGLEVVSVPPGGGARGAVPVERVSSGVARLDAMLSGGYHRGASILITGFPGTAKTTLAGAFAEAACRRGERTLFVSFDTEADEMVRNLASVHIDLASHVRRGTLRILAVRAVTDSAEVHFMRIRNAAREQHARCVVVDPLSALATASDEIAAHGAAERLVDWTKAEGITSLCTSLLDQSGFQVEGTPIQISTIADTWIHLNYLVQAGERNRGLSIIKSRGTGHSNQVRELFLSSNGVTLADAYTAGGEVLMGTLRWEKERAIQAARDADEARMRGQMASLAGDEEEIEARIHALQRDLASKRAERTSLERARTELELSLSRGHDHLRVLRGADEA